MNPRILPFTPMTGPRSPFPPDKPETKPPAGPIEPDWDIAATALAQIHAVSPAHGLAIVIVMGETLRRLYPECLKNRAADLEKGGDA